MIHSLKNRPGIVVSLLVVITIIGAFLRLYGHGDWLHFELDQARDAKIISAAIENGPGELPLQGPRAAGSFLRLGPAFYYIDYISALIFGNTPQGMAMIVTLLSIASIPLLYLLLKIYFFPRVALALTAIYALSPFLVLYGRFSWNPNILPFFLILGMYALLRAVDREDPSKNIWIVVSAVSLAIATQAHFVALLAVCVIVPIFLMIKRPRLASSAWIIAASLVFFIYSPVIINDVLTGGKNVQAFVEAFTDKSEESKHNPVEHLIQTYSQYTIGYHRILTGDEKMEVFRTKPLGGAKIDVLCDHICRKYAKYWVIEIVLMGAAIFLLLKNFWHERLHRKKDFLLLMMVWFGVGSVLFYPIAFDVAPRFFLVTIVIPFVLLGLLIEYGMKHKKWGGSWLAISLISLCLILGVYNTTVRLTQLHKAATEDVELRTADRILKERGRVTLEVQKNVVDHIQAIYEKDGLPVYFYSEAFYKRSLGYLLDERGVPNDGLKANTIPSSGNFYFILRTQSIFDMKFKKYYANYSPIENVGFGTFTLYKLNVNADAVVESKSVVEEFEGYSNVQSDSADHKRYTWGEIFSADK